MNKTLRSVVDNAICQIQKLPPDQRIQIKSGLIRIYKGEMSISESWFRLDHKTRDNSSVMIQDGFYDLGSLLCMQALGPIRILREAYEEDSQQFTETFFQYKEEVSKNVLDSISLISEK